MERILVSCWKLFHREVDPASRAHRKLKGHKILATDGLLHTVRPFLGMKQKRNTRTSGKCLRMQSIGSIWEKHKIKDYNSDGLDITPSSFMTQCQLTALKKVVRTRGDKILYQRIPTPRPPTNVVLKSVWRVQQTIKSSNEQSCAEGDTFKIDLRGSTTECKT